MSTATQQRQHVYISDLHFEHTLWLNSLEFYRDEIGIFEHRLEEVAKRYTSSDVLAQLEHFQNQYIRQREVIDEVRHDIKAHENLLEKEAREHPVAIDHRHFTDHGDLRERMQTFEKLYRELKEEFYRWIGQWM
ncbi:MAG: hypothetical protein IPO05_19150 [Flavobacteriales bacterium]|jgi:hypothetical protein|nr:hypothetical protein [Flavobacteriales bacterium]MBK9515667.1 hypothetical protein [Flavobacteriales bacterium]MBP7449913.1 hypothetical protein [Flavobacteriales bacterium]HOZ39564.1 hypothetical protein [Flavobacteriales bacterium]